MNHPTNGGMYADALWTSCRSPCVELASPAGGSTRQARKSVRVAFLGHRLVLDLLAQVAALQRLCGAALAVAQRVEQALPRQRVFACGGEAFAQFLPGFGAGALGDGAVQEFLGLRPLALAAR